MTEESNAAPGNGGLNPPQEAGNLESQGSAFGGLLNLSPEEQVSFLHKQLQEAREEAERNLDSAQRAQAELANFRRRSDEERIAQGKYSNSRLISKLLPVVEELELAVSHAGNEPSGSGSVNAPANASWLEGVKLIQRKLVSLLESEGVQAIESVGVPFNPMEHEALGTEETTQHPPGHVIQAVRQGYRLHDRVIQPAQVIVAREPQGSVESNNADRQANS